LNWNVDLSFKLAIVSSLSEVDALEIDAEPLEFTGERLVFNTIIEDEILLALPDFPRHEHECIGKKRSEDKGYSDQDTGTEAANPFSVLAKLKKTGE
jgi:uncharacterized protein